MQRSKQTKKRVGGTRKVTKTSKQKLGYAPVAVSMAAGSKPVPSMKSNGNVTRIVHSEYFASVESAGVAFACTSYSANPGLASIFPWLSQVAQRYETYKFRVVEFHYHTRAATSQVGTVGMVFDFDAQDPAPTSQMVALSYHDKVADSCWKEMVLKLDLQQGDRLPVRYTRPGLPADPYDIKTLDLGKLHVFTDGVAASTNLGLLEVCYTIDLYTPQIQNEVGGVLFANTGLDSTHLLGTDTASDGQAVMPGVASSSSTFVFDQCWEGSICFKAVGTTLTGPVTCPITGSTGGLSSVSWWFTNSAATNIVALIRIQAVPGSIITPALNSAAAVGNTYFYFGTAGYAALA